MDVSPPNFRRPQFETKFQRKVPVYGVYFGEKLVDWWRGSVVRRIKEVIIRSVRHDSSQLDGRLSELTVESIGVGRCELNSRRLDQYYSCRRQIIDWPSCILSPTVGDCRRFSSPDVTWLNSTVELSRVGQCELAKRSSHALALAIDGQPYSGRMQSVSSNATYGILILSTGCANKKKQSIR